MITYSVNYKARDFSTIIGMKGFSEKLLKNHFTLYQGYVTNTNKLMEMLHDKTKSNNPEFSELKRRYGWEFNGMRLHEYYFENLGGKAPLDTAKEFAHKAADSFGSYKEWEDDFKATCLMRGIGWVILYQDNTNGGLFNQWINEHDTGHMAGCTPILIADVFEHAYMPDYELKKADYIEAFFNNINWPAVESRLK